MYVFVGERERESVSEIPFHTGGFFFVTEHCPCEVRVFFSVWLFAIVFRLFCSRDGKYVLTHTTYPTAYTQPPHLESLRALWLRA